MNFKYMFIGLSLIALSHYQTVKAYEPSFSILEQTVEKVNPIIKFQARISQAKLPLGNEVVANIYVTLLTQSNQTICKEEFQNVQVTNSILTLDIGHNIDCQLDEEIAKYPNLALQVCIGAEDTCLKPVQLAATPYALQSNYAHYAQEALKAQRAAVSNYAYRISGEQNMFVTNEVGHGYFDFSKHPGLPDTGVIGWHPENQSTYDVRVCGRSIFGGIIELENLILDANQVSIDKDLIVGTDTTIYGDMSVTNTTINGSLTVANTATFTGSSMAIGTTPSDSLTVNSSTTFTGNVVFGTADGSSATVTFPENTTVIFEEPLVASLNDLDCSTECVGNEDLKDGISLSKLDFSNQTEFTNFTYSNYPDETSVQVGYFSMCFLSGYLKGTGNTRCELVHDGTSWGINLDLATYGQCNVICF